MEFPEHKAGLFLTHNEHKNYYKTVAQCIEDEDHGYTDWVSEEQKQKAIETDECWFLRAQTAKAELSGQASLSCC